MAMDLNTVVSREFDFASQCNPPLQHKFEVSEKNLSSFLIRNKTGKRLSNKQFPGSSQ
jgi:hypothetical protein